MRPFAIAVFCVLGVTGCNQSAVPTKPTSRETTTGAAVDRDNTGVNVREREQSAKTPFDQNENKKDIDVTANIRKRVVDTTLSTDAHNVKIITQDGRVTLRGPVKSADEKKQIDTIAEGVAGAGKVDSQLEVVSKD